MRAEGGPSGALHVVSWGAGRAYVGGKCMSCDHPMSRHEMPAVPDLNVPQGPCGAEATDYMGKPLGRPCDCKAFRALTHG